MKKLLSTLFLAVTLVSCATPATKPLAQFNVRNFGAVGDNTTKNTEAFQKALDACSAAGGGEVVVPEGNYLTGSVVLHSNTTLRLEKGVFVIESPDINDYPIISGRFEGAIAPIRRGLIYAEKANHIAIVGPGGFAPNSSIANQRYPRSPARSPVVIELVSCDQVKLDGFNIQYDRPATTDIWCIHPLYCTNVLVNGLYIRSQGTNGDGIDIDSCAKMTVQNCDISAGDDAISIKSGRGVEAVKIGQPSEDIVIKDCVLRSVHFAALGFGTEISGGVRNVTVSNCTISGVQNAVFIKSRDGRGGVMENITMENIVVDQSPTFIGIDLMSKGTAAAEQVTGDVAQWTLTRNFNFKNIKLNNVGYIVQVQPGTGRSAQNTTTNEPNVGIPPARPMEGLTLSNITGTARHGLVLTNMTKVNFNGINVTGFSGPLLTMTNVSGSGLDELSQVVGTTETAPETTAPASGAAETP